jgi:peptide/nickel transport system permease protein
MTAEAGVITGLSLRRRLARESMLAMTLDRLLRNPQGVIAIAGLSLLLIGAVGADLIAWHDPIAQDAKARFLSPSLDHPFGTDELRRDLFARTLFGLRTSLIVSLGAVTAGSAIGISVGFLTGYAGGIVETVAMRAVDALLAFPGLLKALAIITILGPSVRNVAIAIAIFNIPAFARLSRAQMLAEKHRDYVQAAQALGAGPLRVIFRHISWNALPPLLTQVSLAMAAAVLLEAALSFLGLGQRPPDPSLGSLINASKSNLRDAWWYVVFPGATLALLLLCLNLLADAINEATSPYARRRL